MKIKAIIFDLGGTVLTDDWNENYHDLIEKLSKQYGISPDDMNKEWLSLWPRLKIGDMSEDRFWEDFLRISGNSEIDAAKRIWREYQKPIENMLNLVESSKNNYRVCALANTAKEWFEFKRKKFS